MTESDELAARLQSYGSQLQLELTGWPTFVPVEPTGLAVPLLLLRRRLGRWPGAGHRPSFAWLAGIAAVVMVGAVVAIALLGADNGAPAVTESSALAVETTPASEAESTDGGDPGSVPQVVANPDESDEPDESDKPHESDEADSAAEVAEAVDTMPSATCAVGELSGSLCKVVSAPVMVSGDSGCSTGSGFVEDETGCFQIGEATATCPEGANRQQADCVLIVGSPTVTSPACQNSDVLDGDRCLREVPGSTGCLEGQLRDGECVVQGPAPDGGDLVCSVGDPSRSADECISYSAIDCGDLVVVQGGCRQDGAVRSVERCPAQTQLTAGRCEPVGGCTQQHYSKSVGPCGTPAVSELVCSLTAAPVAAATDCVTIVPGNCESGTLSGGQCLERRPLSLTAASCTADFTLVGLTCVRFEEPSLQCQTGERTTTGTCLVESGVPTSELVCPGPATLIGDACTQVSPADLACAQGVLEDGGCRIPVEPGSRIGCETRAVRVFDSCVRYEQPTSS